MMWIRGKQGMINLERIMTISIGVNEKTGKFEVSAYYDSQNSNDLAVFECEQHADAYVDDIYAKMGRIRCTLETANLVRCLSSEDESTSSSVQMDSSQTPVSRPNLPVAPDRFIDLNGTKNQT